MSTSRITAWGPPRAIFCLLAASLVLAVAACERASEAGKPRELYVFNWEEYFAPDTLPDFEKEFGVKVVLETFKSEDEMLAGLQSQPGRYDVVVASGAMAWTLGQLKLLAPVDRGRISNFANVQERFRGLPFDPENRYSIPYLWGTTGLAINTKYIPEDANSWAVLWDPAYKGRLAMLNDPQEAVGAALLALGHSFNPRGPQHVEAARMKLLEQRPLLAGYMDPMSIIDGLVNEKLWAAELYNGDALAAAKEHPNVIYVIPREGAALWVDNLVVPVGSRHREEAELFINYILRPDVAGAIVNNLRYASPNQAATRHIQPDILANPSIYPDPQTWSRLEYYQPLDAETTQRLNRIWAELLSP